MAAGLTIKESDFEKFSQLFDEAVRNDLDEASLKGILLSDGELQPEEFSMHVAETLRSAEYGDKPFQSRCLMVNSK